jgi:choline kinase
VSEHNSPPVAVVLAAGAGTRIGSARSRIPKPLTNLNGVPLLNRALRSVQSAGIEHAVVVVGYRAELVQTQARGAAAALDFPVTVVTNPHWMSGNGSSLLAAAPHVASRCIVVMADHLTPPSFLRLLVGSTEDTAGLLVVDPEPDTVRDLNDATKVRLTGRRIVSIGKQLEDFDAVDTGAFLFDRRIFQALRTASAAGHDELSAAVQHLADDGLMYAVPSDGSFWCDIDTPEDLVFASRALERVPRRDSAASPEQAAFAGK